MEPNNNTNISQQLIFIYGTAQYAQFGRPSRRRQRTVLLTVLIVITAHTPHKAAVSLSGWLFCHQAVPLYEKEHPPPSHAVRFFTLPVSHLLIAALEFSVPYGFQRFGTTLIICRRMRRLQAKFCRMLGTIDSHLSRFQPKKRHRTVSTKRIEPTFCWWARSTCLYTVNL